MPNYGGAPDWYAGPGGWINRLMEQMNQFRVAQPQYQQYPGKVIADLHPLQEMAQQRAVEENQERGGLEFQHRLAEEGAGNIREAVNNQNNIAAKIEPYMQRGVANPVENIAQYMNPYQQNVVENIARQGGRNLMENILPGVNDQFIRSGQYGSTGHQNLTNKAMRDSQEAILHKQGELMHQGYGQAVGIAQGQQGRNLEAGRALGAAHEADVGRKMEAGRLFPLVGGARAEADIRNIQNLQNVGAMGQQHQQAQLNAAHHAWQERMNYPYAQVERVAGLAHGFNGQQAYNPYQPQAPGPNPWGVAGAQMGQQFHQRQAGQKRGGYIKFAQGGLADPADYQEQEMPQGMPDAEMGSMRPQQMNSGYPELQYDQMLDQSTQNANRMPLGQIDPNRGQGGMLSQIYQREPTYAHGGYVHHIRHYAAGGDAPTNPIHKGVNDALDTTHLNAARQRAYQKQNAQTKMAQQQRMAPQQGQQQPQQSNWDFNQPYMKGQQTQDLQNMAQTAYKMQNPNPDKAYHMGQAAYHGAYAGRKEAGVASWGQAVKEGGDAFAKASEDIQLRKERGAQMEHLIGNTQRTMAENHLKHEFAKQKHQDTMGIHQAQLGMQQEEHGWKGQKFKQEMEEAALTKGMFPMNPKQPLVRKNEKGELEIVPISGMPVEENEAKAEYNKKHASEMAKMNVRAVDEARDSIAKQREVHHEIHTLKDLQKKITTGGLRGLASEVSPYLGSVLRAGKPGDIDTYQKVSQGLVLKLGDALKGSQIAQAKIKMLDKSKMGLTGTPEGNLNVMELLDNLSQLATEKAKFVISSVKSGKSAADAEIDFGNYADAKLKWEDTHAKNDPFPDKPEKFAEGAPSTDIKPGTAKGNKRVESMSDEELAKIAGQ